MSQEVILVQSVPGLGQQGEVVRVADGYARNYLLPRNLAAAVTEATRRRIEKLRKVETAKREQELAEARAFAEKISQVSCTLTVKTGAEGKMFGSITALDILKALKEQKIILEKHQLELPEPLRELGVFKVPVKLASGIQAEIKVWIVEA